MERFNRLMINEEEYVLLRAIILSHFVTNGLTLNGQKIMLDEAEKYSKILMKLLQVCSNKRAKVQLAIYMSVKAFL